MIDNMANVRFCRIFVRNCRKTTANTPAKHPFPLLAGARLGVDYIVRYRIVKGS